MILSSPSSPNSSEDRRASYSSSQSPLRKPLHHSSATPHFPEMTYQLLQAFCIFVILVLVWESHHQANFATTQLEKFKQQESLLLLQLQRVEQQSYQLHDHLRTRLGQVPANDNEAGEDHAEHARRLQSQQEELSEMGEELNHQVSELQSRIQASAVQRIVKEYGEGPVKVLLDLEGMGRISILLWAEAPHAAWTWLEQIQRNLWDGTELQWKEAQVLQGIPSREDPMHRGAIEFVEPTKSGHEAWTVGLKQTGPDGKLSMFLNLQDNDHLYQHESNVGKIIDGFDALQKLLEATRKDGTTVKIQKASAVHVTKKVEYNV